MGRQSLLADEPSTAVTMKVFLLIALAARQIYGEEDGSGHGGMGGSSTEGSGSGMGGFGTLPYHVGGSGYGGEGSEGMPIGGSGYGGGECCPTKKIWGSMNPEKDGFYDLVMDSNMMENGMGYGKGSGSGMGSDSGEGMGSRNRWWGSLINSYWGSIYGMPDVYDTGVYSGGWIYHNSNNGFPNLGGRSKRNVGSGDGSGMGSGMGGGYGYGTGSGGMGTDKDDMMWPERCKSFCVYKKRNTSDDRLHCFARSSNSQSMCM